MIETYVSTAAQVFAGNVNLEAAANWIVKHENEPDIDQMPLVCYLFGLNCSAAISYYDNLEYPLVHVSSETPEAPKTSITQGEVKQEEQELREHCKKIEEDKQTEKEREKAIMGKKVKKKTRSGQKEKQGPSTSPRTVSQQGTSNVETPDDGVAGLQNLLSVKIVGEVLWIDEQRRERVNMGKKEGQIQSQSQKQFGFAWNVGISHVESEDNKHKEVLNEVVKLLKGRPGEGSTLDVEDVWFGSGSVTTAIKSDYSASIGAEGKAGYSIRGGEAGLKSVVNPRSLFGSLCTKAPQFRGYQQHDSHELLRCLLDGLSTEELSARKHAKSPQASIADPTFVDIIFGGRLSSTMDPICHSRQETKNASKEKRKKSLQNSREACSIPGQSVSDQSTGGNSLGEMQSIAPPAEQSVLALGDSTLSDPTNPNNIALDMGFTAQDLSAIQNPQAVQNGEQSSPSDNFTWLDYLDPSPDSHDIAITLETDEIAAIQGFANEDILQNDASLSITINSSIESTSANAVSATSLDIAENLNSIEPGALAQQQNAFSQFEYKKC
ncbi:UNVERIFIED_CONTAM: Ubiquitin carboxyl-terminal hydrolase 2 [Sesamum angustifolium]|uniref:Ubiquitin carboxyl-terminal hydrolase 2 n=1 Tax=Sesamum angustifolium TaxID=2727405 RepID=A0AAW2P002_9LAMI